MTIDSNTDAIFWVPVAGDEGVHTITVRANSAAGVFDQSFKLNVATVAVIITRDNHDPDTSSTGEWAVSGGTNPFDPSDPGANSLWARGGDDTFSWYFTAAQTGSYEVWGVAFGVVIANQCGTASDHACRRYDQRFGKPKNKRRKME